MAERRETIFLGLFFVAIVLLTVTSLLVQQELVLVLTVMCATMVVASVIAAVALKSYDRSPTAAYAFLGPTFTIIAAVAFLQLLVYVEWLAGASVNTALLLRLLAMERLLTALAFTATPLVDSDLPFRHWLFRSIGITLASGLLLAFPEPATAVSEGPSSMTSPVMHLTGAIAGLVYAFGVTRVLRSRARIEAGMRAGMVVVGVCGLGSSGLLALEGHLAIGDMVGHSLYLLAYLLTYALVLRRANQLEYGALRQALADYAVSHKHLTARLLTAREDERRQLSHELHDEVGQPLTLIIGLLSSDGSEPDNATDRPAEARRVALETLDTVRRMARRTRPAILDDIGLVAALQAHITDLRSAYAIDGILRVIGPEDRRYAPEVETAVYRAVLEALTNVAKHSRADSFSVIVDFHAEGLAVTVEDDGCGFDMATTGEGLGLMTMSERLYSCGGTCAIESAPGRGTTVVLRIPSGGDKSGVENPDSR